MARAAGAGSAGLGWAGGGAGQARPRLWVWCLRVARRKAEEWKCGRGWRLSPEIPASAGLGAAGFGTCCGAVPAFGREPSSAGTGGLRQPAPGSGQDRPPASGGSLGSPRAVSRPRFPSCHAPAPVDGAGPGPAALILVFIPFAGSSGRGQIIPELVGCARARPGSCSRAEPSARPCQNPSKGYFWDGEGHSTLS